jgi:uncharacterized membrane protein
MNTDTKFGKSSGQDKKNSRATPSGNPGGGRFGARLRTYFLAGILVTAPITITLYSVWIFVDFVDGKVTPLIPGQYNPSTYLPFDIPGLGLVVMTVILMFIGWLTAGFMGRLFLRISERILRRMPVIRSIYSAIKQIFETVLKKQSNAFREAVLVEYPRRGIWVIAFITGRTEGEIQHVTKEEVVNIFLPTTPNPTSGFLLFVPKKELISLSMTVEEAIKMVISGGIVTPLDRRTKAEYKIKKASAAAHEDIDILREKDRASVLVKKKK